jgi:hypothetical protein
MSAVAFAYVLALRGAAVKNELLNLLPQGRRADVASALESVKEMSPEQIRLQLKALRQEQLSHQRKLAETSTGIRVDRISPRLSAWLARPF